MSKEERILNTFGKMHRRQVIALNSQRTSSMDMGTICPSQPPLRFGMGATWLEQAGEGLCCNIQRTVDQLTSTTTQADATFENVLGVVLQLENEVQMVSNLISIYSLTATDSAVRSAAVEASTRISQRLIECKANKDLFRLIDTVYRQQTDHRSVDSESFKALIEERRDCVRKGMSLQLSDAVDDELTVSDIAKRLKVIEAEFVKNLDRDRQIIWLTRNELSRIPEDVLSALETGRGNFKGSFGLELDSMQARQILSIAKLQTTRRRTYLESKRLVSTISSRP